MGRETIKTARPWTRLGPGFTLKSAQPAASQAKAADAGRSRLKPWSRGRGGTGSGILVMIALALGSLASHRAASLNRPILPLYTLRAPCRQPCDAARSPAVT